MLGRRLGIVGNDLIITVDIGGIIKQIEYHLFGSQDESDEQAVETALSTTYRDGVCSLVRYIL